MNTDRPVGNRGPAGGWRGPDERTPPGFAGDHQPPRPAFEVRARLSTEPSQDGMHCPQNMQLPDGQVGVQVLAWRCVRPWHWYPHSVSRCLYV